MLSTVNMMSDSAGVCVLLLSVESLGGASGGVAKGDRYEWRWGARRGANVSSHPYARYPFDHSSLDTEDMYARSARAVGAGVCMHGSQHLRSVPVSFHEFATRTVPPSDVRGSSACWPPGLLVSDNSRPTNPSFLLHHPTQLATSLSYSIGLKIKHPNLVSCPTPCPSRPAGSRGSSTSRGGRSTRPKNPSITNHRDWVRIFTVCQRATHSFDLVLSSISLFDASLSLLLTLCLVSC
jgi:hypothetical protein